MTRLIEAPAFRDAYRAFRNNEPTGSVNGYHADLFEYRMDARNALNERLHGNFWKSPDLACDTNVILPPNGSLAFVDVRLEEDKMPPFDEFNPYALACTYANTRSRFAQLGVEVPPDATSEITRTFGWRVENGKHVFVATMPVRNHSGRPISVQEGSSFAYLYYWDGKYIEGGELLKLMGDKLVIPDKDRHLWKWWYGNSKNRGIEDIKGIEFLLDEESKAWIPPSDEIMNLDAGNAYNHNRGEVDKYLVKGIPEQEKPLLWIAETAAEFEIKEGVNGLVDTLVPRNVVSSFYDNESQTNSVVIAGGNTYGKMRTEIISSTTDALRPKSSVMRFVKAA